MTERVLLIFCIASAILEVSENFQSAWRVQTRGLYGHQDPLDHLYGHQINENKLIWSQPQSL